MPLHNGRLTKMELAFRDHMARTGDATISAKRAGYSHPESAGAHIMARPAMQAAVKERERDILVTELLPLAGKALRDALTKEGVPWGAKMKAVDIVHKQAYGDTDAGSKAPSEMSPDELAAALDKLKSELADRSRPAVLDLEPAQDDIPKSSLFD